MNRFLNYADLGCPDDFMVMLIKLLNVLECVVSCTCYTILFLSRTSGNVMQIPTNLLNCSNMWAWWPWTASWSVPSVTTATVRLRGEFIIININQYHHIDICRPMNTCGPHFFMPLCWLSFFFPQVVVPFHLNTISHKHLDRNSSNVAQIFTCTPGLTDSILEAASESYILEVIEVNFLKCWANVVCCFKCPTRWNWSFNICPLSHFSGTNTYIKAVYELSNLINRRFRTFPYHNDLIFYLSPHGYRYRKACKVAHSHTGKN